MSSTLSPKALSIAAGATLLVAFLLCAIVQAVLPSVQFSHAYIALFTLAPVGSGAAWFEGILYSVVIGLVAGHIFAFVYNKTIARKS
jgi:hypothetical protein